MIEYKDHTLKPEEIIQLNKEGYNLDESKDSLYIIRFLWNNKLNKAYTPGPFRVVPELNDKLVKDAIDMPYIVGPDPEEHLEGEDAGQPNTAQGLLKIQADFAIGDIKKVLKSDTDNFYGIIKIYPDYHEDVMNNRIPMLVSPTFEPIKWNHSDLIDANFLNLNAVNSGGYPVALTSIIGACKNGIKQCMAELSVYAAAGNLKASREQQESFSSTILKNMKPMEHEEVVQIVKEITPEIAKEVIPEVTKELEETVVKPLEELTAKVDKIVEMGEANAEVLKEVATKTEGVDENKVATKEGGETDTTKDTPIGTPPNIATASGTEKLLLKQNEDTATKLKKLEVDLVDYKKDKEASNKKLKEAHVESIIKMKSRTKEFTEDEKTKLTAEYMKKDVDVLETIDNELKAAIPEGTNGLAMSYGPEGFPDMTSDRVLENVPKTRDILAKTIGRQS